MGYYLQKIFQKALFIVLILFLTINVVNAGNNTDVGSYSNLTDQIGAVDEGSTLNLTSNYQFNNDTDSENGVLISKSITVNGNDSYIDGNHQARAFLIKSKCNVVLENLIFKNCFGEGDGGAIFLSSNSNLTLKNCVFQNNKVYNANGAAIVARSSTNINIYSCTFSDNVCIRESDWDWDQFKRGMGSALCVGIDSNLNIYDSVFKNNQAYLSTILLISYNDVKQQVSRLFVRGCLFENNTSRTNTAIYLDEFGRGEILNSIFRNNVATYSGGIVALDASLQATIKDCLFEANKAVKGGSIYIHPFKDNPSTVLIDDCKFYRNVATENGGAVYANGANLKIVDSDFKYNTASNNGGAVFTYKGVTSFISSNFMENNAKSGGAGYLLSNKIVASKSVFNNNVASKKAGGIYSRTIKVSASNCKYINNKAPKISNIYGVFHATVKQTGKYFGGVKLSIKLSSPWEASLAQKIKLKFTSGGKTHKSGWIKTPSSGKLNLRVPVDLKCGRYTLHVETESGVCVHNSLKVKVIRAPVKLIPKKTSAKYNSGKPFKVYVKNKKTNKGVSWARVKMKVYSGKSYYTVNLKANQKGLVKYDTSRVSLGSHIVKLSAGDKNIKSKNAKSKIKISKGSCRVVAPKKIKKHSNLKVKILTIVSKKPIKKTKFHVSVKSKKYNLKTDSKGVLNIKTSKLAKGKYNISIKLKNEFYNINKRIKCKII